MPERDDPELQAVEQKAKSWTWIHLYWVEKAAATVIEKDTVAVASACTAGEGCPKSWYVVKPTMEAGGRSGNQADQRTIQKQEWYRTNYNK